MEARKASLGPSQKRTRFPDLRIVVDKEEPHRIRVTQTPHLPPAVSRLLKHRRFPFSDEKTQRLRKLRVTATDVAKILGIDKYTTTLQCMKKKLGLAEAIRATTAMKHGVDFEDEALRAYTEATGNQLVEEHIGFVSGLVSPDVAPTYVGATPDAVLKHAPVLVEVKCPYYRLLGEKAMHVPDLYIPQVMTQMAVTGIHECHFVQYVPNCNATTRKIHISVVNFDPFWWSVALPKIIAFHSDLVMIREGLKQLPEAVHVRRKKRKRKPRTQKNLFI